MSAIRRVPARLAIAAAAAMVLACAPRLKPLPGAPAPGARLPVAALQTGHRQTVFDWTWSDPDLTVRGEGVARTASPDSARLDFFIGGGAGGGYAVLIGDTLRAPGDRALVERLIPPVPMLWAALGRLALPPVGDTLVTAQGDTIRADFGSPVAWRVTFRGDSLVRVERVANGRVVEWIDRDAGRVRYRNETSRRQLELSITRSAPLPAFDASIWRP